MSRTVPVEFRGAEFWAYDVSLSILLAEMVRVAGENPSPWLASRLQDFRVHAVVGADFALPLDEWVEGHEDEFIALVEAACADLAPRSVITAAEVAEWRVLDDSTVIWRRQDHLDVRQVIALAEALVAIIRGTHPPAPTCRTWFLGTPDPTQTL